MTTGTSAARMRRLRRRRRQGLVVVRLELDERRVKALIAAGYLHPATRDGMLHVGRDAIAAGIGRSLDKIADRKGLAR